MTTSSQMTAGGVSVILTTVGGLVTHLAIGTGQAAVSGTEIALGAEVTRVALASSSVIANSLYLDFYVASSLAKFLWQEVGVVINGTAAAGTGTLISRHLLRYDKAAVNEAATVSVEIPLAAL